MDKKNKTQNLFPSPLAVLFKIMAAIFIAETIIMSLMKYLPEMSSTAEIFLDSLALTIIIFPVIFFFVYKPFTGHIAERKKTEQELTQVHEEAVNAKNQAEDATKLKDKFVTLVAHDLKSPFNAILGYLTLVMEDQKNPLHENHKKMLNRCMESGKGMIHMIQELLKISRLQTGKLTPEKKFFDAFLSSALAFSNLNQLAREKGITLANEVPRGTRVFADQNLFNEVIQNLVSNAIKFCGKGDSVRIFLPPGDKATIAVNDTGVGISKNKKKIIFKHEEKTSTPGTAGEKGTGLGLPLAHDIMAAHGGTFTVESVEGEGSVFYAALPYIRPKILLVEDDKSLRNLFKKCLESMDIDFIEVEDGGKAVEFLENDAPNLILLDILLPVMDGFQVLEFIRSNPKTRETPVIVITVDKKIETRDRAFQLGANDFFKKPFEVEEIIPRIRRFVG